MADVKVLIGELDSVEQFSSTEYLYEDKDHPLTASTIFPNEKLKTYLERLYNSAESQKPTYSGDNISSVEIYKSSTQIDANRLAKYNLTYTNDLVTTEVISIYDADGTTILKTVTITYTYTDDVVTNAVVVTT